MLKFKIEKLNKGVENMSKLKLGVLVSGRGSNLQAIIDAIERGEIDAEIKIVISDREDAYALKRAEKHNIEHMFIDPKNYKTREEYDKRLVEELKKRDVELVCLAGFMRLLSPYFISQYKNKIMNIHPALLPSFPGLNAQKQALEYGVKFSGCTVHFVDEGCDTGPIIIQAVVPVFDNDTVETLSERILKEEHRIYPKAIWAYSKGLLKIEGRRVIWKE